MNIEIKRRVHSADRPSEWIDRRRLKSIGSSSDDYYRSASTPHCKFPLFPSANSLTRSLDDLIDW